MNIEVDPWSGGRRHLTLVRMRRTVGIAVGTVLASSVVVGGLSTPAQAAPLLGLAAFGISPIGYVTPTPDQVAEIPGGIESLCMLGSSCPTILLGSSDESGKAFFESAGTAKSKKQAGKRLSQARSADKVGLAKQGIAITWSKIKLKKAAKAKGIKAWAALLPQDTGQPAKLLMAQSGKRIAYVVAVPDVPVSNAKFSAPLIKLAAGRKKLSALAGPVNGFYGTVIKMK